MAAGVVTVAGASGAFYLWKSGAFGKSGAPAAAVPKVDEAKAIAEKAARKEEAEAVAKKAAEEKAATAKVAAEKAAKEKVEAKVAAAVRAAEEARATAAAAVVAEAAAAALARSDESAAAAAERRANAHAKLQEALATRDTAVIAQALADARAAGLGNNSSVQLAESLTGPLSVVRSGLQCGELDELLSLLPKELRGLSPEAAQRAEQEACEGLSREQLEARVVELSRALATGRLHAKTRLEQALLTRLEAADNASIQDLGEALQRLNEERDAALKVSMAELEADLQKQHEETVQRAQVDADMAVAGLLLGDLEQLRVMAQDVLAEEQSKRLSEVIAQSKGLTALEEVLEQDYAAVQQAHAYNSLSVASLGLEEAIMDRRGALPELEALQAAAAKADAFVDKLLATMPEGCAELCRKPDAVPTEPLLRQQLASQLDDLVAAAFVPPNSGLLGELVGRFFAFLYVLDPDFRPLQSAATGAPLAAYASRNLDALCASAAAARPRTDGKSGSEELAKAVMLLDGSLTGLCRERAEAWLAEARQVLLLRQAVRAAKAKAQCLSMASSSASF